MRLEDLPSPGVLNNSIQLRKEVTRALSHASIFPAEDTLNQLARFFSVAQGEIKRLRKEKAETSTGKEDSE